MFGSTDLQLPLGGTLQFSFQPGPDSQTLNMNITNIGLIHQPFQLGSHTIRVTSEDFIFQEFQVNGDSTNNVQGPYVLKHDLLIDGMGPFNLFEVGTLIATFNRASGVWPNFGFAGNFVPAATPCDVNFDGKIDNTDISAIFSARGKSAGPGDPRDPDGDGLITVNDARKCVLLCNNPLCRP
jgi:hypothetical protein